VDVLVVDPGELGELLATLLEQYAFTVRRVTTGEAALAEALDEQPTVVVVEADLPDTSGLDLGELLRDELGARVILTHGPALLLETEGDVVARVGRLEGAFVRPFRSLSLIERVAELLHRTLSRPGTGNIPRPLSSTEGYAVDELAEVIEGMGHLDTEDEGIDVILDEEVGDDFQLAPFDPAAWAPIGAENDADDDVTVKNAATASISREAARPLDEVLHEAERRHTQTFSPGELAELWTRVKERRTTSSPAPSRPAAGQLTPRLLADLLDAFHQSQTTGELWLGDARGPGRRVLLLQRGVIVGARSNIEGEDLISLLKKRKALSDDDADAVAFMLGQKLHRTVAEAVLALDHVPERVLRSVVEEHVRRVAIGAFSWTRGRYQLKLEGRATREPVQADVHVGDVVVHAIILTESDEALQKAAPADARFAPAGDATYGLEHLKLSPQEARIVIAMDGTKTISDLLALFDQVPARVVRGLAAGLFCLHLTRFAGRGPAKARNISFF
jgi:DNA-binding response OmpR family regulator